MSGVRITVRSKTSATYAEEAQGQWQLPVPAEHPSLFKQQSSNSQAMLLANQRMITSRPRMPAYIGVRAFIDGNNVVHS
jgi:hypothetical protein